MAYTVEIHSNHQSIISSSGSVRVESIFVIGWLVMDIRTTRNTCTRYVVQPIMNSESCIEMESVVVMKH